MEDNTVYNLLATLPPGVTVLAAYLRGSRAYGFGKSNSDHDVLFVYAKPLNHYLTMSPDETTLSVSGNDESGVEVNLTGWGVMKAVKLAFASNPGTFELPGCKVLFSTPFVLQFSDVIGAYADPKRIVLSYVNTARAFVHEAELLSDSPKAAAKACLHALRNICVAGTAYNMRYSDEFHKQVPLSLFDLLKSGWFPPDVTRLASALAAFRNEENPAPPHFVDDAADFVYPLSEELKFFAERLSPKYLDDGGDMANDLIRNAVLRMT